MNLIHYQRSAFFFSKRKQASWGKLIKYLAVMKLASILIIATLQVTGSAYSQQISLNFNKASLQEVLTSLRKQSGYTFGIASSDLEKAKLVTVNLRSTNIDEILQAIFSNQPFEYQVQHKIIMIKLKDAEKKREAVSATEADQRLSITGRVINEKGDPLIGATVLIKGTNIGTSTNEQGNFTIADGPTNGILLIRMVGRETTEVPYKNGVIKNIVLREVNADLSEVQVIAYGKVEKKYLTSNIQSINADVITNQPVTNPLLALQGRVPGLFIQQTSGHYGSGVNVLVQGANSMTNGNVPFYVIDGVPYPSGSLISLNGSYSSGEGSALNFINPNDIESVSILKDADATAIYGSRAANGAILINTKKGKSGDTRVNMDIQTGLGKISRKLNLMNTSEYLDLRREALTNAGRIIGASDYDLNGTWDQSKSHDWQDILVGGTAKYTNLQASLSGGSANTKFYAGGGYNRQTTVYPGDLSNVKGNVHFSLNHTSINQKLKFDLNSSYQQDASTFAKTDFMGDAITLAPNAPDLYNIDGSLNWGKIPNTANGYSFFNPLASLLGGYKSKANNLVSNSVIGYEIIRGLELKTSLGYTRLSIDENTITPITTVRPDGISSNSRSARYSNRYINSWIVEPQLVYNKAIGKGVLNVLAGATFQQSDAYNRSYGASGFTSDGLLENFLAATTVTPLGSEQSAYHYSAVFGRVNYRYLDKYILNANLRRDGSSRFGSENLFHSFYSIGGAWLFGDENLGKELFPFLNQGKLRVTYGTSGNDQIGDYGFLNLYSTYSVGVPYSQTASLTPRSLTNPYLQWEETRKLNIGLDLVFFQNKLTLSSNYFRNRSSNQLLSDPLLVQTGFSSIKRNLPATVQNTGWEMLLDFLPLKSTELKWQTSVNLTIPKNKLIKFDGLANSTYANQYVIGQSTNIVKVFYFLGVNPQTGLYEFKGSKGEVTNSPVDPTDKTVIIDLNPQYYGGFNNSISYKGIELSALIQFVKQKGANNRFGPASPGSITNQSVTYLNRWEKSGDISNVQKVTRNFDEFFNPYNGALNSSAAYSDASYIRLKTASLSYTLPSNWMRKAHMNTLKIFIQGQNIFTITNFDGTDPETQVLIYLPTLRMYTLGFNLTL
jgi:TonB-linked SusC/RagA family outer membrane protein